MICLKEKTKEKPRDKQIKIFIFKTYLFLDLNHWGLQYIENMLSHPSCKKCQEININFNTAWANRMKSFNNPLTDIISPMTVFFMLEQ